MKKAIIIGLSVMALAGLISSVSAKPMHYDEKNEYKHHRHHMMHHHMMHHHMKHHHMMHKKM